MTMTSRSITLGTATAVLLLACAAGCGTAEIPSTGDDAPDDPDATIGAEAVAYDELIGKLAATYCERVFACCVPEERALVGVIPPTSDGNTPAIPDAAACTTHLTARLQEQGRISWLADAVAAGTVPYDGVRAGECLVEYAAMSCDVFGHGLDAFRDMRSCSPYLGAKAAGATCEYDEECGSSYCSQADGAKVRTCLVRPTVGQSCPSNVCADGLFCDTFGDATCKTPLANGADCTFDDNCQSGTCSWELSEGDFGICSVVESYLCDGP